MKKGPPTGLPVYRILNGSAALILISGQGQNE